MEKSTTSSVHGAVTSFAIERATDYVATFTGVTRFLTTGPGTRAVRLIVSPKRRDRCSRPPVVVVGPPASCSRVRVEIRFGQDVSGGTVGTHRARSFFRPSSSRGSDDGYAIVARLSTKATCCPARRVDCGAYDAIARVRPADVVPRVYATILNTGRAQSIFNTKSERRVSRRETCNLKRLRVGTAVAPKTRRVSCCTMSRVGPIGSAVEIGVGPGLIPSPGEQNTNVFGSFDGFDYELTRALGRERAKNRNHAYSFEERNGLCLFAREWKHEISQTVRVV